MGFAHLDELLLVEVDAEDEHLKMVSMNSNCLSLKNMGLTILSIATDQPQSGYLISMPGSRPVSRQQLEMLVPNFETRKADVADKIPDNV